MAKKKLSNDEIEYIKERERGVLQTLNTLKELSKFKEGDFLIAFESTRGWGAREKTQVMNSYGTAKKFIVVHVDANGIPYMKELNKKSAPVGQLISPVRMDNGYGVVRLAEYSFEIDPDYTDSIILEDEANYDASQAHRVKGDLFKEITKHNKSIKVKVNDSQSLISFLKTLKVGDVLWRSIKTNLTITQLDPIPVTHKGTHINEDKIFGRAKDSKGKEINLNAQFFKWYAIYTGRPRSYNELKDPK